MPILAKKPATTPIPVQLSDTGFHQFILPHLSMPKRGPKCKLGYHGVFNLILWVLYTGMQWKCLPVPKDSHGKPAIHYTTVYKVFAKWSDDGSLEDAFIASVKHLADQHQLDLSVLHGDGTNTVAKKGGDGIGYSGHKHQKGEKVIAIIDNNGYVLVPLPVAPVNAADTVLLPEGLQGLKRVAKRTGLVLEGAYLNLDGGFDSKANRKAIFNAGMIPNIKENPCNRTSPKRGRKRWFNGVSNDAAQDMRQTMHDWRMHLKPDKSLEELARKFTPVLRGGINYYGRFYKSALYPTLRHMNRALVHWVRRKDKRFKRHRRRAEYWLGRVARRATTLFAHWQRGIKPAAG